MARHGTERRGITVCKTHMISGYFGDDFARAHTHGKKGDGDAATNYAGDRPNPTEAACSLLYQYPYVNSDTHTQTHTRARMQMHVNVCEAFASNTNTLKSQFIRQSEIKYLYKMHASMHACVCV